MLTILWDAGAGLALAINKNAIIKRVVIASSSNRGGRGVVEEEAGPPYVL